MENLSFTTEDIHHLLNDMPLAKEHLTVIVLSRLLREAEAKLATLEKLERSTEPAADGRHPVPLDS